MKKVTGIVPSPYNNKFILYDIRYIANGKPKIPVVFMHGFKGFKDWGVFNLLSEYFARQNFVFIKFNFSHNGTNMENPVGFVDTEAFGNNNFLIELADLERIIDYLINNYLEVPDYEVDIKRLTLLGHSRGGSIGVLEAATNNNVAALATWAAVSNFEERWHEDMLDEWHKKGVYYIKNARTGQLLPLYYQLAETYYENKDRLYIPVVAKQITQPAIIIHGKHDEAVPFAMGSDLHQYIPDSEFHAIDEADHTFGAYHPYEHEALPTVMKEAADKTISFIKTLT